MADSKSKICSTTSCGTDVVTRALGKVGVCRSMLITLALLPFAWNGVTWVGGAVRELWELIQGV
jgi:hypothetical protein